MKLAHVFTEDERRVIAAAFQKYMSVVQVIADLHNLQGGFTIAPDMTGFVQVDQTQPK